MVRLVLGTPSERKAPQATTVVSPNAVGSFQFDEFERMTHMTPTSPSSSVTSSSQFSAVKLSTSSMDRASVHSLTSPEMRRDSFPPYVSSSTKRSTAIVAPSVARTQSTPLSVAQSTPVTSLRSPLSPPTSLRSPVLPSSTHHRWLSSSPLLYPPRSTQSLSKVMSSHRHGHPYSTSVCRSSGTRSLLGPPAASSGISYSLALSSALTSSSRSSAVCLAFTRPTQMHPVSSLRGAPECQRNASNLSTCLAFTRHTPMRPVDSLAGTSERRGALLREMNDMYTDHRSTRELNTSAYSDLTFTAIQRRISATNTVLTTAGRTTSASSHSLMHRANLAGYQPYLDLNQASRPATAQYSAAAFPSSSLTTVSSQLQSSHTPPNSGTFTEIY